MQHIVEAFGSFSLIASGFLGQEGLGTIGADGLARFEPDTWYPLKGHLKALARAHSEFGEYVLRQSAAARRRCLLVFEERCRALPDLPEAG